ncbi:MAG: hypothetical protein GY951_04075, partial [Psychromonas sp.]|nr:hypothetical protein [Psychromonas sp.]
LIEQHKLYINRFNHFVTFNDFYTLTAPTLTEPVIDFSPIVNALRLINLSNIYLASTGEASDAIDNLLLRHKQLRELLMQQDTLIGKLFLLNLISENIDLTYLLARKNHVIITRNISLLTAKERSFTAAFSRELRMMNHMFQSLDRSPDIFSHSGQEAQFTSPAWLTRMLYK